MSAPKRVKLGKFSIAVPGSRAQRTVLGGIMVGGGALGFLPILGFWMLPLGLLILSVDYHPVRRLRRKTEVWWGRRQKNKADPAT